MSVYNDKDINKDFSPLTMQTLEMDADVFATRRGVQRIQHSVNNNHQFREHAQYLYKDLPETLYLWCFSVYGLFRLFGDIIPTSETLPYLSHPPFALRQIINFNSVMHEISPLETSDQLNDEYEKLLIAIHAASIDVEASFKEISEDPQNAEAFKAVISHEEFQLQLTNYLRHWANLRPLLENFTFRPLPPISEPQDLSDVEFDDTTFRFIKKKTD